MDIIFRVFFVIFLIIGLTKAKPMTLEEKEQMGRSLGAECQKEVGGSDAELENVLQRKLPVTRTEKCLNSCLFMKAGIIKDGKWDPVGSMALTKMVTNENPKMISAGEKVIEKCGSTTNDDVCELSVDMMKCTLSVIDGLGITLHELI